jgi:cytochrome c oxidase cbb3-type subunit 3
MIAKVGSSGSSRLTRFAAATLVALVVTLLFQALFTKAFSARAQESENPLGSNPKVIAEGASQFRINCAFCHGLSAHGGARGPDLTRGVWNHGGSDADIFRTITQGVPGTLMPANDLATVETWEIIMYLRSLSGGSAKGISGDRKAGAKIFFGGGNCSGCHMVNGKGGRVGPDLSRVGAARSPDFLGRKLRDPNKTLAASLTDPNREWPLEYEAVTVVTTDNVTVAGVLRNEDSFSIQLMDLSEGLHSYWKRDLLKVTHQHRTVMPAFGEDILDDLQLRNLVAYLDSLRPRPEEAQQ